MYAWSRSSAFGFFSTYAARSVTRARSWAAWIAATPAGPSARADAVPRRQTHAARRSEWGSTVDLRGRVQGAGPGDVAQPGTIRKSGPGARPPFDAQTGRTAPGKMARE